MAGHTVIRYECNTRVKKDAFNMGERSMRHKIETILHRHRPQNGTKIIRSLVEICTIAKKINTLIKSISSNVGVNWNENIY